MNEKNKPGHVENQIYRIRGRQMMFDAELASLYGVETFNLNKAVRRNPERFPTDFVFQLTPGEWQNLIFQTGISKARHGGCRHAPFVFTQEGIAMLSGVLQSKRAIQVNVAIMRVFVKLRHAVSVQQSLARRVEKLEGRIDVHETDIRLLVQDVEELKPRPGPDRPIKPSTL